MPSFSSGVNIWRQGIQIQRLQEDDSYLWLGLFFLLVFVILILLRLGLLRPKPRFWRLLEVFLLVQIATGLLGLGQG